MDEHRLKNVLKIIYERYSFDAIPSRAAEVSFYLLLFIFPFIIFLISIVGFIPLIHINSIMHVISKFMPYDAFKVINYIAEKAAAGRSRKVFCVSLFFMFWSSISGVKALIRGINKAYDREETRSFFAVTMISLLFTAAIVILLVFSMTLIVYGEMLGKFILLYFNLEYYFYVIWNIFRYSISLATMIIIFASLYLFTPNNNVKVNDVMPGTIFSTVGWIVTSYLFSYYANNNVNYSLLYGSIGGIIALLSWLYLSSHIILIGAEINSALFFKKQGWKKLKTMIY